MSNDFTILNYLGPKTDNLQFKWDTLPFVVPSSGRHTDHGLTQDNLENVLHRHLRPLSAASTIQIRQVRHILGPVGTMGWQMHEPETTGTNSPEIAVRAVRPFARKSMTSTYWQDSGWEKRNTYLIGHYTVGKRLFPGSIALQDSVVEPARYYVYNPPTAVLKGPHGPCFRFQENVSGTRKYWIHFSKEPSNIDSGIIQIERDISSAIGTST